MPPILEIADGRGRLVATAPLTVLATMCHPENPEARARFTESTVAKALLESGARLSRTFANLAAQRAAEFKSIADNGVDSGYGIAVAGDLLLLIVSASLHSPKDASLERAVRVWAADQARGKTFSGRRVAASRRSILAAWTRFKPVAHLCAALRLSEHGLPGCNPAILAELPVFLAIAEILRHLGERHHPPAGRTGTKPAIDSTLDPETTWRTPLDLVLPGVTLGIPPLTEYVTEILKGYTAD